MIDLQLPEPDPLPLFEHPPTFGALLSNIADDIEKCIGDPAFVIDFKAVLEPAAYDVPIRLCPIGAYLYHSMGFNPVP